jgi:hypothetical protein
MILPVSDEIQRSPATSRPFWRRYPLVNLVMMGLDMAEYRHWARKEREEEVPRNEGTIACRFPYKNEKGMRM